MEIVFNKKFYKLFAIKKATKAYRRLASFRIKSSGKYYMVVVNKINPALENMIED